jgi:hypothetical protein
MLATAPDHEGWDIYAAPQVVPHCHFTPLIQHIWRNPAVSLGLLSKEAVVFHQDKVGRLIQLLDEAHYARRCRHSKQFSYAVERQPVMTKYYRAENTNRAIKHQGHAFVFEPYECFAGTWRGVYQTDKESEQIALDDMAQNPSVALWEIDETEYARCVQKKTPSQYWVHGPRAPKVPQPENHGRAAAVVVEPKPVPAPMPVSAPVKVVDNLDDALQVGNVSPSQPPPAPTRKAKAKGKGRGRRSGSTRKSVA